jgi:polar amino acid transport system ATP-binding protein
MIAIRDLSKSFGSNLVLDGISLDVAQGEVVCVIGASGSGKSTLLRCINGLETYDAGDITIDGEHVDHIGRHIVAIREKVAMVFQRFNLFPHRTALENVIEGPVYVKREPREAATKNGIALLAQVGWPARRTTIRIGYRGASSSASRSPARWRCSPVRSCSTSRPRRSIRSWSAKC